jgi:alkylglycerol monooxygenase
VTRAGRAWLFATAAAATAVLGWTGPVRLYAGMLVLTLGILIAEVAAAMRSPGSPRAGWVVLGGLGLSLAGDLTLLYGPMELGIGFFLLAQIAYLGAMGLPRGRPLRHLAALLPAAAYGAVMALVLLPRLSPDIRGPVVAYLVVICAMAGRASGRALVEPADRAARLLVAGAALFVLSDSLIAIDLFVSPLPLQPLLVMPTYYGAQWLLSRGLPPLASGPQL